MTWNGSIAGRRLGDDHHHRDHQRRHRRQTSCNQGTVNYDSDGNGTNEATGPTDDPGIGGATDPTSFIVVSPVVRSRPPRP